MRIPRAAFRKLVRNTIRNLVGNPHVSQVSGMFLESTCRKIGKPKVSGVFPE
jgi:hypothetical protein